MRKNCCNAIHGMLKYDKPFDNARFYAFQHEMESAKFRVSTGCNNYSRFYRKLELQQPGETVARLAQAMTKHMNNPSEKFQAKSRCLPQHQFHIFSREDQEMTFFRGDNGGMPMPPFNNGNLTNQASTLEHGNQDEFTGEYSLHLDGKFPLDQKPHKIARIPAFHHNFPRLPLPELKIGKELAHLFSG